MFYYIVPIFLIRIVTCLSQMTVYFWQFSYNQSPVSICDDKAVQLINADSGLHVFKVRHCWFLGTRDQHR
ncbi:unnamed protein product [Cyberlindnera jadinii]|uniref:Uncharacterized protein n=1 Tax=Cyberlindnera jadinii (strain ATCC 18201 / CBS 1600 / BCRC 20928 / JCM 3617 / NBRC 0987 / NRRL Y-1542) TaxID=983966 RepID=A0A0H5C8S3_CYBJN|nr:unnamed protein product [Cyberlindnera jadinii]